MPDTPLTVDGLTGYFMYGAKSYTNGITEIKNISKIYGNGDLAESATGMSIDHVNQVTGVTVNESSILPEGIEMNSMFGWNAYGSEYSFAAGSGYGWDPRSWLNKEEGDTDPGISGKTDAYVYQLADANLKLAGSPIRYGLIDKTGSSTYFLASRGVFARSDYANFGHGTVGDGLASSGSDFFCSNGDSYGYAGGVRPVVSLKADVIGEIQSTDSDGVATWHIE